ncbi:hypothetical protein D3C78_1098270 [compost metagenome]
MMFSTVPDVILPTVSTALSSGSVLRETRVCSWLTRAQATGMGSMVVWGMAAWPPLPLTRISKRSAAAMMGPTRTAILPAGSEGQLCSANTASQGNRVNRPSSIIARAPAPPSSPGWKIRCTEPSKSGCCASSVAAPSSMVVWPSWPQACMRPGWVLIWPKLLSSCTGRASMSARMPMLGPGLAALRPLPWMVATTPVWPRPRCTLRPSAVR